MFELIKEIPERDYYLLKHLTYSDYCDWSYIRRKKVDHDYEKIFEKKGIKFQKIKYKESK